MSERLSWPDTAKALGMFLVFFGHLLEQTGQPSSELSLAARYIYAFHMPLFFLMAGYFFRVPTVRFGALVVSKLKSRFVPVVFFSLLALPFWQHPDTWLISNVDPSTVHYHLWRLLRGFPNLNWPCWFLVCLMMVELLAAELVPLLRSRRNLLLAIPACYVIGRFLTDQFPVSGSNLLETRQNIWFLQESLVALSFYLAGHALALSGWLNRLVQARRLAAIALLGGVFVAVAQLDFAGYTIAKINMSISEHGHWLYFPLAALAGSLAFLLCSQLLPPSRLLTYIGNNTLPLIGINGLFVHFFNRLIYPLLDPLAEGWQLVAIYGLVAMACLGASLPLVWLLDRLVPKLVGKWR